MEPKTTLTRRQFLITAGAATTTAMTGRAIQTHTVSALPSAPQVAPPIRILDGWEYFQGSLGGPWDVWRKDEGNNLTWRTVRVPHCFNAHDSVDPDEPYYQGPGWYRNRLEIKNPYRAGRTVLHFEGAGQKCEVFAFLDLVGDHVSAYDEFTVDITDAVDKFLSTPANADKVPIAIRCDNSRDLQSIPSALNDFCRYGGLHRYVNLIYKPALSLDYVHIDVGIDSSQLAQIAVKAKLYNPTSLDLRALLSIHVYDPEGLLIHTAVRQMTPWDGEQKLSEFAVESPKLWFPSEPSLYHCEVVLDSEKGSTAATERFGIRFFEFAERGPFKLNGQRLLLRGTQREEDHAGLGSAMTEELIETELRLIKEMGANFLGLAHHQQSKIVLDLCDDLGLLVLESIPWSRGGIGGEQYKRQARDMLGAMIKQHYNHPSIILWGLGNETDWPGDFPEFDKSEIRVFTKELNELAHSLDPTRKSFLRRCEFCKDLVDVYSPSLWAGWYHGPYTKYKSTSHSEMEKVNRFLHVEWGAESYARRHSEETDRLVAQAISHQQPDLRELDYLLTGGQDRPYQNGDWSETYACNLFDWHLKEQESMPWLTGAAQWIFKDFATPLRPDNPVPYVNQKGLVERDLTLKEAYYVFQSYWTMKPMIHIYGHSWPVRWGELGEAKLVKVYSNCDSAELFLNDESCGLKKRRSQEFPAAGLHWLVKFKAGKNRLRAVGRKNGASVADEMSFAYQTARWQRPSKIAISALSREKTLVTIETQLLDSAGVLCLDARNRVRFALVGDGALIDNLGTSSGSRVVALYNGKARISLQTNGGMSVVSVSSNGLPTSFLNVA
jgi:beta-galactosidase